MTVSRFNKQISSQLPGSFHDSYILRWYGTLEPCDKIFLSSASTYASITTSQFLVGHQYDFFLEAGISE